MQQDRIISALIGLVGACNNNSKTENTDSLVLRALSFPSDGSSETELLEQIREEKNTISPGCATCATPCGNTSDYDMSRIHNAEPIVRDLKQQALESIRQFATFIVQNGITPTEQDLLLFYKVLSYVSYDLKEQTLLALIEEIDRAKTKTQEMAWND